MLTHPLFRGRGWGSSVLHSPCPLSLAVEAEGQGSRGNKGLSMDFPSGPVAMTLRSQCRGRVQPLVSVLDPACHN